MSWADVTLQPRFPFLVWHNAHFIVRFPGLFHKLGGTLEFRCFAVAPLPLLDEIQELSGG
jgi:hypothetical protein